MNGIIKFARSGKRLFVALQLQRLIEPINPVLLRICFLSKQAKWIQEHPAPFNDNDDPDFRYDKRYQLYDHLLHSEKLDQAIHYLEFGVAGGHSFRWWVSHNKHPDSKFVGFDTFTGLPEQWGVFKEGAFSGQGAPPEMNDPRCSFEVGLFQDTLPGFLRNNKLDGRKVIHMDADLYSSTLYALTSLAPYLNEGDILFFDEFGVPTHEFRAFTDFVSAYRINYQVLGAVNNYLQVGFKIGAAR